MNRLKQSYIDKLPISSKRTIALLSAAALFLVGCGEKNERITPNVPAIVKKHLAEGPNNTTIQVGKAAWTQLDDSGHYYLEVEQPGHPEDKDTFRVEVDERVYKEHPNGDDLTLTEEQINKYGTNQIEVGR